VGVGDGVGSGEVPRMYAGVNNFGT
jgi:hypothetical protein